MAIKDKIPTLEQIKAAFDVLVKKSDVVNNLTSTATNQPLSAAQGKALKELVAQSTAYIDTVTIITNLNNVPVNNQGRIKLGASVSPTGEDIIVNFSCSGNDTYTTLRVYDAGNGYAYSISKQAGTWGDWLPAYSRSINPATGASANLDKRYKMIAVVRYFNGATKSGLFAVDFSNTVGALINTFTSAELTVTYSTTNGWSVTNNVGGNVTVIGLAAT